jgi:hypothetical protein
MEWGSAAQDTQSEAEKRQLAAQEERLRRHHMQVVSHAYPESCSARVLNGDELQVLSKEEQVNLQAQQLVERDKHLGAKQQLVMRQEQGLRAQEEAMQRQRAALQADQELMSQQVRPCSRPAHDPAATAAARVVRMIKTKFSKLNEHHRCRKGNICFASSGSSEESNPVCLSAEAIMDRRQH